MKKIVAREEPRAVTAPNRKSRARLVAPAALAALLAGNDPQLIDPGDADADAAASAAGDLAAAIQTGDEAATEARPGAASAALLEAEARLRHLAQHDDAEVRAQVTAWLPAALEWMSQLERIELVASWATAESPHVRLALARSLQSAPAMVGLHSALEALSVDPDPGIRLAVAEAAWVRRFEAPGRLMTLLERLSTDPDEATRAMARRALGIA